MFLFCNEKSRGSYNLNLLLSLLIDRIENAGGCTQHKFQLFSISFFFLITNFSELSLIVASIVPFLVALTVFR